MRNKILLFLKGILMGICDLIPGVSGGTIAFITGIYDRLINAVRGFSLKLLWEAVSLNPRGLKREIAKLDFGFLIILFSGITSALFLGSGVIEFLLENYTAYTLVFFVGLIITSSKLIFDNIENHSMKNKLFAVLGVLTGLLLYFVIPVKVEPTLGYVFVGGFLGVCAMFLPGISGAFALLILGLYDFMINVLQDIVNNFAYFIVFMLGAVLGAFAISRAISFLFRIDRCKTLYFLLGLVIGSLSIPVKRIAMISSLEITNILTMSFFFLIGVLAVLSLEYYRKKYEKKLQEIEDSIAIQLVR